MPHDCGAEKGAQRGDRRGKPGEARVPELAARPAQGGAMRAAVPGMGIAGPPVGMVAAGGKEVEVDAVHGFRPRQDCCLGMPEKLRYCDSGKSTERKINLHVTLARPSPACHVARL